MALTQEPSESASAPFLPSPPRGGTRDVLVAQLRTRGRSLAVSNRLLVATAFLMAFLGYHCSEKIQVMGGYGWDGSIYGALAEDFYTQVFTRGLSDYRVQRILPSAVVHYSLRLLRLPRTQANVIAAFGLLNVALVTLAAGCWCRLADHEKISSRGKWLGFVGLFVNFALWKWTAYYPVLTDMWAFVIGLLMLYCYLTDRLWRLGALTFLGAFIWPTLLYHGLLLVMFPRRRDADAVGGPAPWCLNQCLAGAVAVTVCVLLFRLLRSYQPWMAGANTLLDYQPLSLGTLAALACVGLFLFFGMAALWNHSSLFRPLYWLKSLRPLPLLVGIAILVGSKALAAALAGFPDPVRTYNVLVQTGWLAVKKPFLFGIAHVVYFGPIVLLALLRWRAVCCGLHGCGLGLTLCVSATLLLGLHCESRFVLPCFPIVVFGVVKAMEDVRWRALHYGVFVVLALFFSKCWLQIGGLPDSSHPGEFPAQLFFMNLGPWMSGQMFLIQGAAVGLAGIFLLALLYPPLPPIAGPACPPGVSALSYSQNRLPKLGWHALSVRRACSAQHALRGLRACHPAENQPVTDH
jgi:hypothetical protein